jgi:hypothetical protein
MWWMVDGVYGDASRIIALYDINLATNIAAT